MDFQEVEFYNYTIRMTVVDGVEMYLVSDLLKQYNEINGTKREMRYWLRQESTQELLNYLLEKQTCENLTSENSTDKSEYSEGKFDTGNFRDQNYIPKVIEMIEFSSGKDRRGYIVNAQLLHDILLWADRKFAYDIYTFLEQVRKANNEYLLDAINQMNYTITTLKKRYVIDNVHQQWSYVLKVKVDEQNNKVYLKSSFAKCDYKNKEDQMNTIYYVRNLPNGYTFRYFAYDKIMSIVEQYGGYAEGNQRSTFVIPLDNWDNTDERFDWLIRNALKQTRIELCW